MLTHYLAAPTHLLYAALTAFFLGIPLIWFNDYSRHRTATDLHTDGESLSQLG